MTTTDDEGGGQGASPWQPIETAPKDGTWIVIGQPGWSAFPKAKWKHIDEDTGSGWLFEDEYLHYPPGACEEGYLGWQDDAEEGFMPTIWQPAPEAGQ